MDKQGNYYQELVNYYNGSIRILYGRRSSLDSIITKLNGAGVSTINFVLFEDLRLMLSHLQQHQEMLTENDIKDDEIITARYADTGDTVDPSFYNQYSTIEGLFSLAEHALEKDPADLAIAYNEEFGYIKELTIDYKENIADDEVTIIASNMKPSQ